MKYYLTDFIKGECSKYHGYVIIILQLPGILETVYIESMRHRSVRALALFNP